MNRNFISLIIAVLFSSASFAQQYEYKLTGITSKHTNDYYKYFYDDANGRVDSAVQYRELAGFIYDYTLKYVYDENGNEVLEKGYQGAPDKPCGVGRADANPKLLLNDT